MTKKEEDCEKQPYIALCERVRALEVKMNIVAFVSGATFISVVSALALMLFHVV